MMRCVTGPVIALVLVAGCAGDELHDGGDTSAPAASADTQGDAGVGCGDAPQLPVRARREDRARTMLVGCDGDARELALTVLDDGIVRLRYGADDRGSIVPVEHLPLAAPLRTGARGSSAVVCTTQLEIAVEPGRCTITAKDVATGAVVIQDGDGDGYVRSRRTGLGASVEQDVAEIVHASPESERFYGLGLHTAAGTSPRGLDLRGSVIELYNTDAYDPAAGGFPPKAPHLYESIPFYVGLRGSAAYGIFTDETRRTRFDLASSEKGRARTTAFGTTRIDQYLVAGPHIADVVRRFTRLTGRAPLPPPWALGFHQSRWDGPCDGSPSERSFCSASQIVEVARRFRDARIPADGLFLDIQHMNGFRSFTFDGARFPDPEGLVAQLDALGFKTQLIVDPGIKIDPAWDVYASGIAGAHFLEMPEGVVFEGEVWPGPSVFPDFSAARTRSWWSALAEGVTLRGIRGLWIDMNEPASFKAGTVPDETLADGDGRPTTMAELHNAYALFEARATYEGMKAARPDERPFILSRAAFAGQQRWSAVWTGDAPSTWATLATTLPQLLHLGMSGMTFAGSDIGGYSGRAESTPELFTRWMSLGAVSPFFRAHAERDARRQEPWAFGREVEDATRELISLRYELMPYLYSTFDEAHRTGAPVLRPLVFEFQEDERTHAIADEAMLGGEILVAPILSRSAGAGRAVYLPASTRWFELWSGAAHDGGATITLSGGKDALPMNALPAFVREGAIVPRTEVGSRVFDRSEGPLLLDVFPAAPTRTSFVLYEDDGKAQPASSRVTLSVERTTSGARLSATSEGTFASPHPHIIVRFRRTDHRPSSVTVNGTTTSITWDPNDRSTTVTLPNQIPFVLDIAYDAELGAESDVTVPVRVKLPRGTPASTPIRLASSRAGWTHAELTRTGDEATGTIVVPRGGWSFYKITRGGWLTVEKDSSCADVSNRAAFGAPSRPLLIEVARWADLCP